MDIHWISPTSLAPNNFFITYEVKLISRNSRSWGPIEANDICDIDVQFRDIKYEYIWGYLGTQTFEIDPQVS
jgi:hypothetical protein